ncbi:hypothetical protein HYT56_05415 [Candidatus Woesearchaeota archaeon]|nr:hypothetical protein [Candidatus Woesearchaeota archaeon]
MDIPYKNKCDLLHPQKHPPKTYKYLINEEERKMGTSTIYEKMNDLGLSFRSMTKKDLKELDKISPYKEDSYYRGWSAPFELHNGNVYVLVFWKGRLMKLEEAPKILNKKYYSSYKRKTLNEYEWTLLKKFILNSVNELDKDFKKTIRNKSISKK